MDYKQIVWLASFPKSGNTWLRMFLDAYVLQEVDINDVVCSVTDDNAALYGVGNGENPTLYPIDIQQLTRPMAMLRLVKQYEANKIPNLPLFVKTHSAHLVTNGIELLPEALTKAVIHIVRDPRDVMPSFAEHMGIDYDKAIDKMDDKYNVLHDEGAPKMGDLISDWGLHTKSFINSDTHNIKTFRYEDMKAHPVETFSAILKHAGMEVDVERVKKALELVKLDRLKKQEETKGFKEASKKAGKFFGKQHKKIEPRHYYKLTKRYASLIKRLNYGDYDIRRITDSNKKSAA